jgi:diguanylate cyclase (GGDEF)-like protein
VIAGGALALSAPGVVLLAAGLDHWSWRAAAGAALLTAAVLAGQFVAGRRTGRLVRELDESMRALREAVAREQALAQESAALAAELTVQAVRDPITGLGNRSLLDDRLTGALARARRTGHPVGMLRLDLDGFQRVNEVHGHHAGDDLLKVVADRLRAAVRTEDTIARLSGDEFVVIAEDLRTARDLVAIAERIVAELDRSVPVGGRRVRTPASVGIALSRLDADGPAHLLREAGAAMQAAKRRGGGCYQLHGAAPSLG